MANDKEKPTCIQVELVDYCFDQEVLADPEYDKLHESNILNKADNSNLMLNILDAPDDTDLEELRNLIIVDDLLSQKVKE